MTGVAARNRGRRRRVWSAWIEAPTATTAGSGDSNGLARTRGSRWACPTARSGMAIQVLAFADDLANVRELVQQLRDRARWRHAQRAAAGLSTVRAAVDRTK